MRLGSGPLACLLALLAGAVVAFAPGHEARAGAWVLEEGRGLVIAGLAGAQSGERFDEEGASEASPAFRKTEAGVLAEYGLTERLTLRMKGGYESWRVGAPEESRDAGFAVAEIGGRLRLFESGPFVGSVEASLRIGEGPGDLDPGFEGRLLAGYGFEIAGLPAFADLQLGWRHRPELDLDEALVEATLGVRPVPHVLLLLQGLSSGETERDGDFLFVSDRHKLQASAVFDVDERWSVQVGLSRTLAGANVHAEKGFLTALWLRF